MSTAPFVPITREAAAEILAVSITTIEKLIVNGTLPIPRRIGGRRLYWHPSQFYAAIEHALLSDECADTGLPAPEHAPAEEPPLPASDAAPAVADVPASRRRRPRNRGRPTARARRLQAIEKLDP